MPRAPRPDADPRTPGSTPHHAGPLDARARHAGAGAELAVEGPVRWTLVRRLRREIAQGRYATTERLEAAVARLLAAMS